MFFLFLVAQPEGERIVERHEHRRFHIDGVPGARPVDNGSRKPVHVLLTNEEDKVTVSVGEHSVLEHLRDRGGVEKRLGGSADPSAQGIDILAYRGQLRGRGIVQYTVVVEDAERLYLSREIPEAAERGFKRRVLLTRLRKNFPRNIGKRQKPGDGKQLLPGKHTRTLRALKHERNTDNLGIPRPLSVSVPEFHERTEELDPFQQAAERRLRLQTIQREQSQFAPDGRRKDVEYLGYLENS